MNLKSLWQEMDLWFLVVVTLSVAALLRATVNLLSSAAAKNKSLPPGPLSFPFIGNLLWLRKPSSELKPVLRSLHARHGPMDTIHIGPRPAVYVSSPALAHQALVRHGAIFADRRPPLATNRVLSANQHNINSSSYGPTWRLLRRNLTAEILHSSRLHSYSCSRTWVLDILVGELKSQRGGVVRVVDHFQYANLVKYPEIQERLYDDIKSVVGHGVERVKEEDLQRMGYLKAVVLEGLRRHPPAHFVAPHAVTEDAELGGYVIPKDGTINFTVAEMGWDPEVWEDPMAFKPERFLNCEARGFDITGSREIKMMPFGAGRRICPGYGLAMLHLENFVANLVWLFRWQTVAGEEVDLSEKLELTMVMKNPLRAQICPRNSGT